MTPKNGAMQNSASFTSLCRKIHDTSIWLALIPAHSKKIAKPINKQVTMLFLFSWWSMTRLERMSTMVTPKRATVMSTMAVYSSMTVMPPACIGCNACVTSGCWFCLAYCPFHYISDCGKHNIFVKFFQKSVCGVLFVGEQHRKRPSTAHRRTRLRVRHFTPKNRHFAPGVVAYRQYMV